MKEFIKKIIDWFKASNRFYHLILGIVVGLFPNDWYHTELLGAGVSGAMEFKDYQWGGKPDIIDFILTFVGVNIGHLIRILIFGK